MQKIVFMLVLFGWCTCFALAADNFQATARGAQYKDLKPGSGDAAATGDIVTMHFIYWLDDNGARGREFYNTRNDNQAVSFVVGSDNVMPGWNEGVIGMRQGGKRLLKLPPVLAYGEKGVKGVVPPNTRLLFLIDLIRLEKR